MKLRRLPVNLSDDILILIKKRAGLEGKSASEIARELIESALDNPSGSGDESRAGSPREIDTDKIREAVMDAMKAVGHGIPPEALRYLVQDVAKIEDFSRQLSLLLSPGKLKEHEERWRIAAQKSNRILKGLKLDGIEDVDKTSGDAISGGATPETKGGDK